MKTTPFDHSVCTRCNGRGNYSFNLVTGTRCFGCNGSGYKFTKKGKAANQFYQNSLNVKAKDAPIGSLVKSGASKIRVVEVVEYSQNGQSGVKLIGKTFELYLNPETIVQVLPSVKAQKELFTKALEYQDKLTKAGTLKKKYQ